MGDLRLMVCMCAFLTAPCVYVAGALAILGGRRQSRVKGAAAEPTPPFLLNFCRFRFYNS